MLNHYDNLKLVDLPKVDGISDGRPQWADGHPEPRKTAQLFLIISGVRVILLLFERDGQGRSSQLPISDGAKLNAEEKLLCGMNFSLVP